MTKLLFLGGYLKTFKDCLASYVTLQNYSLKSWEEVVRTEATLPALCRVLSASRQVGAWNLFPNLSGEAVVGTDSWQPAFSCWVSPLSIRHL